MRYASSAYWDGYFRDLREQGNDLDWEGRWTDAFVPLLRGAGVTTVLELGCGTGNDAARLARDGFQVVAVDYAAEAIEQARSKYGSSVDFRVGDMAESLPFPDMSFDAVMSNVALHMFDAATTASIFGEIHRVTAPGGLFLFHVNSEGDRALRERRRPIEREVEPGFVLESAGQTVRFFSLELLEELLSGWASHEISEVEIVDDESAEPFKRVWRGVARR